MQVSLETTGNIDRKMTVELPAAEIDQAVEKRLKSLAGRVRIDGFRPGKVPFSLVKKRYADSVRYEVVESLLGSSFQTAAAQENLRVAGLPEIDLQTLEEGKNLQYTATFQVYPEFTVASAETLTLTRTVSEVTDADLDKMIDTIRKQNQDWKEIERAAQSGDMVNVDFAGTIDGEAFDGGTANDYSVELGAGRMLKDFEAGLIGMQVGEEKTVDVAFPDTYHAENLKGKTAQFKLSLKRVREPVLPEVDADFIKKFGVEDGSVENFRVEVKKNMSRELDKALKNQLKQQVMEGLAELNDIEVPKTLVKDEVRYIREEFQQNTGSSAENLPEALFEPQAARRVKLGLIVGEIIRQHNLQRDPARVDAMLESLAASYEEPQELINYYRQDRKAMQTIEAAVMEEMIVDWALSQAKVTDETRDFDSVMNPQQQAQA